MKAFVVKLPWPPSINDYWDHASIRMKSKKTGKPVSIPTVYLSKRAKAFRADVIKILRDRLGTVRPAKGRLAYRMRLRPPQGLRRIRDLSNFTKGVEDALTHAGLIEDDSQFDRIILERGDPVPRGMIEIAIWKHERQGEQQKELFQNERLQ